MEIPGNGFAYLQHLREKTNEERQSFSRFERYLEDKARERGTPIRGQFELTPLCNFDCKMCYAHLAADQLEGHQVMQVSEWKDLMKQAYEMGMYKVTLTGGECLSYPGFKDLYLYLNELGCNVTVLTNGYLLDDEWIEFFTRYKPELIRVTLYGSSEEDYERVTGHRGFARVCRNIDRIKEADIPLTISVTPNRYLGEAVLDTIRVAKSMNKRVLVSAGLFDPKEETGRSGQKDDLDTDEYLEIYRLLETIEGREIVEVDEKDLPPLGGKCAECPGKSAEKGSLEKGLLCGGGRSSFVIDWKGTMLACNRFRVVEGHPREEGFAKAWEKVNHVCANWPRVPECEECAYRWTCTLCAANMLGYAEPGKQPVKMCERVRYLVKNGVWHIPECD